MIIFGNFLLAMALVLHVIIQFFYFLMLARVILSWVSPDPRNPIVQFIYNTTEPLLSRVRDKIPPMGMIDLSPLVFFVVLIFLDAFLPPSLHDYGAKFLYSSSMASSGL